MKSVMLQRLQPRFKHLIEIYQGKTGKDQKTIASDVGLPASRLSGLLTESTKLSATYLEPFIWGGVIKVADIYDGKPETAKEVEFWKRMSYAERTDLTDLMVRLENAGKDPKRVMLEALIEAEKA